MNLRDVLIRLWPKRTSFTESSFARADEAIRSARPLGQPISTQNEGVRLPSSAAYRSEWVYWRETLGEFGLGLRHIARRGHASLHRDKQILIRVDTGQWQVQRMSVGGWETIAGDWGTRSLRIYLAKNNPPPHPLFEKK
jgi:hypothetical protein